MKGNIKKKGCSRPAAFWEFVPDMLSIKTERCFSVFSSDSGDRKRTCPRPPERSGWFIV